MYFGIQELEKEIFGEKDIVLIVGAGINSCTDVKLSWSEIINPIFISAIRQLGDDIGIDNIYEIERLFQCQCAEDITGDDKTLSATLNEFTPQIKASIAKSVLKSQYMYSLRDYIYDQCNKEKIRTVFEADYSINSESSSNKRFYTLYTVARMILLNANIVAVVTYNYDNFLKQAIDILQNDIDRYFYSNEKELLKKRFKNFPDKKLKVWDVWEGRNIVPVADTFFIYHSHGFLPPPSRAGDLLHYRIVLSSDEYYENTNEVYSQSSDTQVHFFTTYTCIVLGSSFTDMTPQRMLHYAKMNDNKNRIYYLDAYEDKSKKRELKKIKYKFLIDCGLSLVIGETFEDLFNSLNVIVDKYVQNIEK